MNVSPVVLVNGKPVPRQVEIGMRLKLLVPAGVSGALLGRLLEVEKALRAASFAGGPADLAGLTLALEQVKACLVKPIGKQRGRRR